LNFDILRAEMKFSPVAFFFRFGKKFSLEIYVVFFFEIAEIRIISDLLDFFQIEKYVLFVFFEKFVMNIEIMRIRYHDFIAG